MKLHEYNEMMSYVLRRPMSMGGSVLKPKRGLVDEPGSYSLSEKALKNIKEFEKRTGLKYEEINDRMKKRVREGDKNVGRNILVKKFEESKEGQKIIKDFEERTGKKYADQLPGTRKSIRDKTFAFSENIPTDDPKRLKTIKDYIKSVKKEFGYNPTKQELRDFFKKTTGKDYTNVIAKIAKEIDLPSGKDQSAAKAVDRDVKKLLESKTITNTLDKGKFPTDSQIKNILKVDPTIAETRAMDLADTLTGNRVIRLFNAPTKYKQLAKNYIDINSRDGFGTKGSRARRGYEKALTQLLDLPKGIANIRRDILNKIGNFIPELKGKLAVDEIASITSSMRRGSGPYAIFAQVLGSDFNSEVKGGRIDSQKGTLEKKLVNLAKNDPERIRLQQLYNKQINKFELEANKNNPIKKVKGLKLSFEPPSKTVKNKKVYNQYKDLFDAHYNKYGYSFEVPADRDSIVDISKKLDNKSFQNTIKNRFKKLIGKGGKFGALVGLGTLAGTGFALADEPEAETPDDFPTGKVAAGAAAAPLATKKGRSIYGKAAKQIARGLGKTLAVGALPLEAGFVLSDLKSGASTPEALANIVLLGGAVRQKEKKDFISNKYGPEVYAQIQSYKSFGEDGMDTPQELPEQFKAIELEAEQFLEDERTRRAEEFARQTEEDRSLPLMPESMTEGLYAFGGRVGFAEGPKDPGRRKFIKLMGILAALPYGIGKLVRTTESVAPVIKQGAKIGYDKFLELAAKIKILGKKDPGRTTMDRQEVTVYRGKDGSEYELTEDITTGDVRITKDKPGMAQSGDEVYDTIQDRTTMEYKKGSTDVDPKTGKKIQYPDEYEEVKEVAGPDGTFDDIDEVDDIIAREIDEEIK